MREFSFKLRFRLPRPTDDPRAFLDDLYREGCEDALIGVGQIGAIALDFTRAAATREEAVAGAVADVLRAIPGAAHEETAPSLLDGFAVARA